jgi:hypothetical protein
VVYIKRFIAVLTAFILILTAAVINKSYALWRQNAEVKFTLTISQPPQENGCCICGKYTTIQEGIDLLKHVQFPKIYGNMDLFKGQLNARAKELENLPFGGITYDELKAEVDQYRDVDIQAFVNCINTYADCIRNLNAFYQNSTEEEKQQVPDFWSQHSNLWSLHTQLWSKHNELYTAVNAVWAAGEKKIDYNKDK